jgi:hypothetical protein
MNMVTMTKPYWIDCLKRQAGFIVPKVKERSTLLPMERKSELRGVISSHFSFIDLKYKVYTTCLVDMRIKIVKVTVLKC